MVIRYEEIKGDNTLSSFLHPHQELFLKMKLLTSLILSLVSLTVVVAAVRPPRDMVSDRIAHALSLYLVVLSC